MNIVIDRATIATTNANLCNNPLRELTADGNFRDFQMTPELLHSVDGNYHEPAFHIDGDGIGVIASAAVDTAYFEVLRP